MPTFPACRIARALVVTLTAAPASWAAVVDFGSSFSPLPYTEDGLRFVNLPGTTPAVVSGIGALNAGTNSVPIHVRASADTPFDLISIDIQHLSRTWRVESSAGAVMALSGTGILNVSGSPGWTNIIYFDLIHNPGEPNGSIRVDDVTFEFVGLQGDYNANGIVDAADYTVWRDTDGTAERLATWQANFGMVAPGAGSGAAVPEPASLALCALAVAFISTIRNHFT